MIAYLKNEDRIWEIPEGESTVGRGADCTLPLDAGRYPEISRKHVRFTCAGGVVAFHDENSANGTIKNGVRISAGELLPGDTLELGKGGPIFEMWQGPVGKQNTTTKISHPGIERLTAAKAVSSDPITRPIPKAQSGPRPSSGTRELPALGAMPGDPKPLGGLTPAMAAPRANSGSRPLHTSASYDEDAFVPPPAAIHTGQSGSRIGEGAALAIEQRLVMMQKLVVAVLGAVFVMLGLLLYQNRQIQQNRDTILSLQQQAASSVSLLMPEVDQRMNRLNERLDSLDPKMLKAEDRMVERMNHEMPVLLDKYLNSRMSTVKPPLPQSMVPTP